jgi:hypothetical protein
MQHGEHRQPRSSYPHTTRMGQVLAADMASMKSWIDSHPDYLLVLISDHGVDDFGPQGYRMHGLTQDGNQPFMLVYPWYFLI